MALTEAPRFATVPGSRRSFFQLRIRLFLWAPQQPLK